MKHFELYAAGALRPHPAWNLSDIPIRVDHIKDAPPIGWVTALRTDDCWTGGMWQWIHAEINDPPAWLRKGTPVSISRAAYDTSTHTGGNWPLIRKALLTEVSILSPGHKPAHPRAQVEWIGEPEPYDYRPPHFDELELLVGYKVTWDNFEQANTEASRTPIQKHYDEHMAAKRATSEPQVLRPGIGQVLAVGGVPVGELAA